MENKISRTVVGEADSNYACSRQTNLEPQMEAMQVKTLEKFDPDLLSALPSDFSYIDYEYFRNHKNL